MDDREMEDLLRSFEGPEPSPETTRKVMDTARRPPVDRSKAAGGLWHVGAPRARARRAYLAAAAIAACALFAASIWWVLSARREPVGAMLSDGATVRRGGSETALLRDAPLFAGDELTASERTEFRLNDGSAVKLDRGAFLAIVRPPESARARLRLKEGRVFLRVAKGGGEFAVAGSAEVRVLGTCFGVEEKDGRTTVSVWEGLVALRTGAGEIQVARGHSGSASAGAPPEKASADPNDALLWAREVARFERRPLGEVLDWIAANSTFRFDVPGKAREEQIVSVSVAEEPMRQVVEALMLSCNLPYSFDGNDVKVREIQ